MENKMKKIMLASLLIVVFILGVVSGIFYYKKYKIKSPVTAAVPAGQITKDCWDQAKQRLTDSGIVANLPSSPEVKSVYGIVTAVSGNKITLKIKSLDILADPDLDTRIIEVSDATKLYQMVKNENVAASNSASSPKGAPPKANYQNKEIKIGDLKAGNRLSVLSDNDIKNQKNIKANTIVLIPAN